MLFKVSALHSNIIMLYNNKDNTKHLKQRDERIKKYEALNLLNEKIVSCFKVDKQHKNGYELHAINENGLIYVYNFKSRKLITVLHARSEQIKRYYKLCNIEIPKIIYNIMQKVDERNKAYNLNNMWKYVTKKQNGCDCLTI